MSNLDDMLRLGVEDQPPRPYASFSLRSDIIQHKYFCETIRKIADVHFRGRNPNSSEGLAVVAQTGTGKTTLLQYYRDKFPRVVSGGATRIPVLLVVTPEAPTVKSLAEAILLALGDVWWDTKTSGYVKTQRVIQLIKACQVELLLIDEFQHFTDGNRADELGKAMDWLKNFFNKAGIPVVLSGLPVAIPATRKTRQLRRRFCAPHYYRPFGFSTEADRLQFRAVLKEIHQLLPVECVPLYAMDTAHRFFVASNGLTDYVVKVVERAVADLPEKNSKLTLIDFAHAFRNAVWKGVPDNLNPFTEKSILRPMTKPGEPFDIWDDPSQYGLI